MESLCTRCRNAKWDYYPCEGWLVSCKRDPLPFNPDRVKKCPYFKAKKDW